MGHDGDIWIRPRARFSLQGDGNLALLEERFERSFVGGFPVLLASARVGIMLTLKNFHNSQYISIFPYASQCVVKAAFLAEKTVHTPLPNEPREIIHNQWGLHQNQEILSRVFLEDSADSLYPLGGTVCKTNSRFEVWSLPKLLGTTFGGIIWCRSKSDALALKEIRNNSPKQNLLFRSLLSILKSKSHSAYQIWENYEFSHPVLNKSQVKVLSVELDKWDATYVNQRSKYQEAIQKVPSTTYPNSQELDSLNFGVIPTVVECKFTTEIESARELSRVYTNGEVQRTYVYAYQNEIITK
jgi:putative PLP-dependent aminotransferase (TIGR04422 family)